MAKLEDEAQVKAAIRGVLDGWGPRLFYEMNVPYGYGKRGLDFNGCAFGQAFYIEAKRPGKYPTMQQCKTLRAAAYSGARCFIISTQEGVDALSRWIKGAAAMVGVVRR